MLREHYKSWGFSVPGFYLHNTPIINTAENGSGAKKITLKAKMSVRSSITSYFVALLLHIAELKKKRETVENWHLMY